MMLKGRGDLHTAVRRHSLFVCFLAVRSFVRLSVGLSVRSFARFCFVVGECV